MNIYKGLPSYIKNFDTLRALSVFLVFFAHTPNTSINIVESVRRLIEPGWLGVDIFFVLSGFLITRIIIRDSEKGSPIRYFWYRRILRIFPIYFLVLLSASFFYGFDVFIPYAGFYQNYYQVLHNDYRFLPHTWSLAVEEQFYLIWPLLMYKRGFKTRTIVVITIIFLSILSTWLTVYFQPKVNIQEFIYRGTNFRMLSLALGGGLAVFEPHIKKAWVGYLIFFDFHYHGIFKSKYKTIHGNCIGIF